jgi:hypothetical protein
VIPSTYTNTILPPKPKQPPPPPKTVGAVASPAEESIKSEGKKQVSFSAAPPPAPVPTTIPAARPLPQAAAPRPPQPVPPPPKKLLVPSNEGKYQRTPILISVLLTLPFYLLFFFCFYRG